MVKIPIINNYLNKKIWNRSEINLFNKSLKNDITFEDIVVSKLNKSYNSASRLEEKIELFFKDFKNSKNFSFLHLNTRSSEISKILKELEQSLLKENDEKNYDVINFCIISTYDIEKQEWNNKNSCVIFFDIKFTYKKIKRNDVSSQNGNNFKRTIEFIPKRIEFINSNQESNSNFIKRNEMDFVFLNNESQDDLWNENHYAETWKLLIECKKILNFMDEHFDNRFKLNMWYDFIKVIAQKYRDDNTSFSTLCFIDDETDVYDRNNIFICSQLNEIPNKDIYLYPNNGSSDNVKINLWDIQDETKIENIINKYDKYFEDKKREIKSKNERISHDINFYESEKNKIMEDYESEKNKIIEDYESERNKIMKEKDEFTKNIEIDKKIKKKKISKLNSKEKNDIFEYKIISLEEKLREEKNNKLSHEKDKFDFKLKEIENIKKKLQNDKDKNDKEIGSLCIKQKHINNFLLSISKSNFGKKICVSKFSLMEDFDDEQTDDQHVIILEKIKKSNDKFLVSKIIDDKNLIFNDNMFNENMVYLSKKDIGLKVKLDRYNWAIDNTLKGYYKNPYMLFSLYTPSKIIIRSNIDEYISNKYNLNKKQKNVVNKAINTIDSFYLQGPPGTGKTQTICAISEHIIKNNGNVLMTSSTHEAISNFLERLDEKNNLNPNIFIYKVASSNDGRENKFDVNNLYSGFIKRVFKHVNKNPNEEIDKILNKLTNDSLDFDLITFKLFDFYIKKKDENSYQNNYYIKYIGDKYGNDIESLMALGGVSSYYDENNYDNIKKIYDFFSHIFKKKINEINDDEYKKIINYFDNNFNENNKIIKFRDIKDSINKTCSYFLDNMKEYYQSYSKKENNFDEDDNKSFSKWLFDNNYINVIGLTTTSRTDIVINGIKKDIYLDYDIDTVIIDEISKSNIPEVISRINFSKKVIFSGDYMQLPPSAEIEEHDFDELSAYIKKENFFSLRQDKNNKKWEKNKFLEKFRENYENNDSNNDSNNDDFYDKLVNDLLTQTFFKNQVEYIKKTSDNGQISNYGFLNEQHRFNSDINEIVNCFYTDDERLICALENQWNKKLSILWTTREYNGVYWYDTSKLNNEYIKFLKTNSKDNKYFISQIDKDRNSFDQDGPLISKLNNLSYGGLMNEYNIFIVSKIIKSIIEQNKDKGESYFINKIGIIALTSNQKKLLRHTLKEFSHLKLKIDTIDNFQGREKEYIIVDLIRSQNKYDSKKKQIIKSNKPRNLDFLMKPERINVAFSRAKIKLIIVGSLEYYCSLDSSDNVIEIFKKIKNINDSIEIINVWEKGIKDEC